MEIQIKSKPASGMTICFAGNMLGKNPGMVPSQGEKLAELFSRSAAHKVICVSGKVNRAARLGEIAFTLIKDRRAIDIVVLDVYSGMNLFMADSIGWLCRKLKLPLIMVLHGGNLPSAAKQNPRRLKRILSRADAITAPSKYLAEAIGRLGFEIEVIPNMVDVGECRHKSRSRIGPKLLWMRSFHPLYNPEMALLTLSRVLEFAPDASLTMAGRDKGCETDIREIANRLGLTNHVRFCGWLDKKGKDQEFEKADIFLNTNNIDNTPVSIIEACAYGLPVIATEVGGIPYFLNNGSDALLIPKNDAAAMANEVRRLLADPELVTRLSENGKKLAERSSRQAVKPKWEKKFAAVLSEQRGFSRQILADEQRPAASRGLLL